MIEELLEEFVPIIIMLMFISALVVGLVLAIAIPINAQTCESRWENSGYESEFGVFSGCRIVLEDGRFIPQERFMNMRGVE